MIEKMEEQKPGGFLEGVAPALMTFEGLQDVGRGQDKGSMIGNSFV